MRGKIELIIVDDGSTDNTSEIVSQCAQTDERLILLSQTNQGKAVALQAGLDRAKHEFIVTLDADTQCTPDAIEQLIALLASDPQIGAVSGHLKVGNRQTFWGRFQSLEYVAGFNLDRRAYDLLDCITVVPGALSAYRKTAISDAGGLSMDTLAEDTDLTLAMHKAGWIIRYNSAAVGLTEAPDTARGLIRQRTRWSFGTLQCLFKHTSLLFNPDYRALAYFSLPSIWFCHIFLVAIAPLVDGLLLTSLLFGAGVNLFQYALFFLVIDLCLATAACMLERNKIIDAWLVIPMRFIYRPILCIAVWASIIRALRGVWFGWGRTERRGNVIPPALLQNAK